MIRSYPITPVSCPRMTQRDKRGDKRPAVAKFHAFRDEVRLRKLVLPPSCAHVTFVIPMPKSWSARKKIDMRGTGVMVKRRWDLDNLEKSLLDSMPGDDSYVWDLRCTKVWGYEGRIIVETP